MSHRGWSVVLLVGMLVGMAQFGMGQLPAWVVAVPFVLLAMMEATEGRRGDKETGRRGEGSHALAGAATGRGATLAGGVLGAVVFHGIAMVAVVAGHGAMKGKERHGDYETMRWGEGASGATPLQAQLQGCGGGGCGTSGGCGTGGCGASSGGACGCGSGKKMTAKKPASAMPVITPQEMKARAAAIQKRTMTLPPSSLPGIGPNARPLPVDLQLKAGTPMPKGVVPLNSGAGVTKSESVAPTVPPPGETSKTP